jgi:hypothetical protein
MQKCLFYDIKEIQRVDVHKKNQILKIGNSKSLELIEFEPYKIWKFSYIGKIQTVENVELSKF